MTSHSTNTGVASTPKEIAEDKPDRINGNRDQWQLKSKTNTEIFRKESQNSREVSSPLMKTCHVPHIMDTQC